MTDVLGLNLLVPYAEPPAQGYVPRHLEVRLTAKQARGLRHVVAGLDRTQALLDSGRRVVTHIDAIRWLTERVADSIEAADEIAPAAEKERGEVAIAPPVAGRNGQQRGRPRKGPRPVGRPRKRGRPRKTPPPASEESETNG